MQFTIDQLSIRVMMLNARYVAFIPGKTEVPHGKGETPISACADLLDKYNDHLQTRLIAHFNR